MPNVIFASNNLAHWPTALPGSQPGAYAASRVPYSIAMSNFETLNSPKFKPSTTTETWFHFRLYVASQPDFSSQRTLIQALDANGNIVFNVKKRQNFDGMFCTGTLYDGTSSVTGNTSLSFTVGKLNFCDVCYTITGLKLQMDFYVNGALALTLLLNSNPNNFINPNYFSLGCAFSGSNLSGIQHVSEILVADGDTRNARLDLLRPTAVGSYEQWLGPVASLADDDTTTGMTTIAANQKHSVLLSNYTGASNVSNFVIVSQTTRGQNSPTKLKHLVRMSGVDYETGEIELDFPLQYNLTDFPTNPATSLPWVASDLNLLETGFTSVA